MHTMLSIVLSLKNRIVLSLNQGHERSVKAKKNIFASFLIKGISILIGFFMVPITLDFVHQEHYGIWLTLSSIIAWFSLFESPMGNGLKNKLAESLARNELDKAKTYVSTTYAILTILFGVILFLFFVVNPFLDWARILNTDATHLGELRLVVVITFSFFCINFVVSLIHTIFYADQSPALSRGFSLASNVISFAIIYILSRMVQGSLLDLALILSITPVAIMLGASLFLYRKRYQAIAPSIKHIRMKYVKDLMDLSIKFFFIDIAGLIIYSTDNLIITQLYGPSQVPAYAIAHKYFDLLNQAFGIICVPFWAAFTEAYINQDIEWILATNKTLVKLWVLLLLGSVVILLISNTFYRFWVPEIQIPFMLSFFMWIYVITLTWGSIFVVFVNGVGKIKLQLILTIVGAIVNIPLSIFFAKYCNMGLGGIILASTICLGYRFIIAPIQFYKIIHGKAHGIWNA